MTTEDILFQFAAIILLGIMAQWIAARLQLPAILLLLLAGFAAGPILGIINPDELLGSRLFPFVSVSVGIILFEGSLSLKLSDLRQVGRVVRNLVTIGALVTWVLSGLFAYVVLGFEPLLAIQLGAILVVTGPTVVIPLLRFVRPAGASASVLRWEGIMIDPVGASLALLVFEFLRVDDRSGILAATFTSVILTIVAGTLIGYLAGRFLELALRRYWVPDQLQTAVTLMLVVVIFVVSDKIQHESGLLATTIMGITLANQKSTPVRHLMEFKENLGVLLLSTLFILLSARLDLATLSSIGIESLVFLAMMILIVRPASVLASTLGSSMPWPDRLFLMWMAPRGIVAASVASLFSIRLVAVGYQQAEQLVPVVFVVIVGTCTIYGLTARLVAGRLKLSQRNPQGVIILGAHPLGIAIGRALHGLGKRVVMMDTNYDNIKAARMADLKVYHGNALSEATYDELDIQGIGYLLALTSNDEVNALAAQRYAHMFGRVNIYQFSPKLQKNQRMEALPEAHGRLLFTPQMDFNLLSEYFQAGGAVKVTPLTDSFTFADYRAQYGVRALPFAVADSQRLTFFASDASPAPQAGQSIISLIRAAESDAAGNPIAVNATVPPPAVAQS